MCSPDKSLICVTGGSGYIGSWVVKSLLEKGYTVHVTTRKKEKALHLKDIECATEENLKIFDGCDLSVPDSHDKAIEGCYAVIHCASPFFVAGGSRENLIDPAVKGTEMVLNACKKFKVQRVTLTGSVACVAQDFGTKVSASESGNYVYTSEDYSPVEINEEKKNYYPLSKIYAEKRAWELSKEEDCPYKLCVLLPGLVWGPLTKGQTHLNTSSVFLMLYMDGIHKKIQNGAFCVTDVRDIAEAHIAPIEKDVGWGKRYLIIKAAPRFEESVGYIKEALENNDSDVAKSLLSNLPTEVNEELMPMTIGGPQDKPFLFDASPSINELGIKYRSVKEMVTANVNTLLENNFTGMKQYNPKSL